MITGQLRNAIDRLWTEFWTGGITNPLTVIEQISFLMFARMLDLNETRNEKIFRRKNQGKTFPGEIFPKHRNREKDRAHLRWDELRNTGDAGAMHATVRDELFPFLRQLAESRGTFGVYMKDANLAISKPSLLRSAMEMIHALPLDRGDTKGDLYEYLLSKLTTAGINGQFRTPRHIIRLMAELLDPRPGEVIGDPACGTAGFLVGALEHIHRAHSSKEEIEKEEIEKEEQESRGVPLQHYAGDLLKPEERRFLQTKAFYGFDFDISMLRIAAMNLMLHGVDNPHIEYQDTLSNSFPEKFPKQAEGFFDVILANPPFKGALDEPDVHPSLTGLVKTKKTELLFLALMLRMLRNPGGRCASVVPDGVLFGTSKAHVALRRLLVEKNQLDAVISLPSGVFKPYAGVSTAILVFTRGGETKDVFFYDVQADGYSLDDKRERTEADDLPGCLKAWNKGKPKPGPGRTGKAFLVPRDEIAENRYDLSIGRYKEVVYEEVEYESPKKMIRDLRKVEDGILADLRELELML